MKPSIDTVKEQKAMKFKNNKLRDQFKNKPLTETKL